jgi:uncharacterized protein (TIGR03437 family)
VLILVFGAASHFFYGEAPGLVSGVMQFNVQIPANAPSGNIPMPVFVGGNSSQSGVTVSVQWQHSAGRTALSGRGNH